MIRQVIIIGSHIQALGLARQAKRTGIRVILFTEERCSVARFSRAVRKTVFFRSMDELGRALKPYEDTDTLLFPTADQYVEYLAEHDEALKRHFTLGIPAPEVVALFADKRKAYQFADACGIPHPKSCYPATLEDVVRIAGEVSYPVVIKPAVMYSFRWMFGKKAFRCDSPEELIRKCREISKRIPISSVIIQEFLSGGAKTLYSFGAFVVDGEPKAWIMANRIRQNPMDFGNSTTFAVTCHIPAIETAARDILKRTNYTGLAEVEYMYDAQAGCYKFMEINTRAWKWHSLSMGLGFGFLSEMLHYLNGESGDFRPTDKQMAWTDRLTDLTIILKETLKGRMNPFKALHTCCRPTVRAVWSWQDPLPGIMYLLLSPILYFQRKKH
ncbi:MAG: hypothetical protein J5871_02370 [Bacteroidales bacterium]|nr:hypothetical protein [Bacteroidales bacterium]